MAISQRHGYIGIKGPVGMTGPVGVSAAGFQLFIWSEQRRADRRNAFVISTTTALSILFLTLVNGLTVFGRFGPPWQWNGWDALAVFAIMVIPPTITYHIIGISFRMK